MLVVAEEVVDNELFLSDVGRGPGAPAAHLLIENGAADTAAHHQVQQLAAVKSGVEHTHADRNHWQTARNQALWLSRPWAWSSVARFRQQLTKV